MYRICFVCSGNICRSPMAEAVCRAQLAARGLDDRVVADSAGTGGWHAGEPADPRAVATLDAAGYDPGMHTARRFESAWFDRCDLVVALDQGHERWLRRAAPTPAHAARVRLLRSYDPTAADDTEVDVPDPYYGDGDGFETVLKLVEAAMAGLLDEVAAELPEIPGEPGERR